jgi:hypothetical protein
MLTIAKAIPIIEGIGVVKTGHLAYPKKILFLNGRRTELPNLHR